MNITEVKDELESQAFEISGVIAVGIVNLSGTEVIEVSVKEDMPAAEMETLLALIKKYQHQYRVEIKNAKEFKPH